MAGSRAARTTLITAALLLSVLSPIVYADLGADVGGLIGGGEVVYVVDEHDEVLLDLGGSQRFTPASTLKVFTTLLAATHLGLDFRFTTEFFLDGDRLVVRGGGDPFLVSEELDRIAGALQQRLGNRVLDGIVVDDSFFAPHITIPGVGDSLEPYDAPNSATGVNFNTISLARRGPEIVSAEPQTPLTPLALTLARQHGVRSTLRINLGNRNGEAARYAGELIAAKLRAVGVHVGERSAAGRAPAGQPLYVHYSSRTLADVCREMLYYSNNYVANQVFLAIGTQAEGPPASLEKSVGVARQFIAAHAELRDITITEGSGISYDDQVTAPSMAALLKLFVPYKHILRAQDGILHKTGTLQVTKTLIGYMDTGSHGTVRFVIRLDGAKSDRRWQIVERLRGHL